MKRRLFIAAAAAAVVAPVIAHESEWRLTDTDSVTTPPVNVVHIWKTRSLGLTTIIRYQVWVGDEMLREEIVPRLPFVFVPNKPWPWEPAR